MKENICRFISSIQKIEGSNNLIELARKEKRFIDLEYPNIFTRRAKYRNYRNAIKLTDPNSPLLNVFTLSKEEAAKFKEDYAEKVKYDQTHLRQIYDFDALLSKALDLIEKGNYYEQVLGFAALTGRRTAEIGCTANFKVVSPYHVIFSGQLKTKGKKEADNYQIPILRKCHFVIEHFYFFRSKWKVRNVDVFNNTCATELSSRVKRDFQPFVEGDIKAKDLRAIYATIACHLFKPSAKLSDNSYIADILGHSKNDLTTCQSYIDFYYE